LRHSGLNYTEEKDSTSNYPYVLRFRNPRKSGHLDYDFREYFEKFDRSNGLFKREYDENFRCTNCEFYFDTIDTLRKVCNEIFQEYQLINSSKKVIPHTKLINAYSALNIDKIR